MDSTTPTPVPISTLQTFTTTTLSLPTATLTRQSKIEGDDHMIYLITESPSHILRVTKPRPGENRLLPGFQMQAFDIAIRGLIREEYLARGLDADLIPASIGHKVMSEDGVYAASVETKLTGTGLHLDVEKNTSEATVRGLVELMRVMRGVDVRSLEERLGVGFSVPSIPFPDLRVWRERAILGWKRLIRLGQVDYGDQAEAEGLVERKTEFIQRIRDLSDHSCQVFIHNDIKGEHILVDGCGRITGILDWADAGIGCAATDIAGLVLTVGTRLATRIAAEVGYGEDEILRGVMQARCECVSRLDERLNGGDEFSPIPLLKDQLALSLEECELVW
ncbi:hypothetical protein ETB97_011507 [Aspergillus alliaceus]|uniref:Aminoglycoside phosphotransferase domain-containing protein n=1 Tax=Petromyces alliaceus TaxID=209559 RepID=A0A8H6A8D4_PETAA|nr:hypothetical protein ETB97_011507 [Aspergillus burnettii]